MKLLVLTMKNVITVFGLLQETQLSHQYVNVLRCWDNYKFGAGCVEATGRSDGLLSIWNNRLFKYEKSLNLSTFYYY